MRRVNGTTLDGGLPGGVFGSGKRVPDGPYLGDILFMGRAFLTLYAATADRAWLRRAEEAVQFISTNFEADIGYITSAGAAELKSKPQVDENVGVTRLANLLHQYTGSDLQACRVVGSERGRVGKSRCAVSGTATGSRIPLYRPQAQKSNQCHQMALSQRQPSSA